MSAAAFVHAFFGASGTATAVDEQVRQESLAVSAGLKRQDAGLLDELIVRYQHRLLRYLLYLTSNREMAEDLFQEVWMRVLVRGGAVQRPGAVRYLAVYHCAQPGDRPAAQAHHVAAWTSCSRAAATTTGP